MAEVKVTSTHKAGRTTQVMMDNFADIAELANNKLIDSHIHADNKAEHLRQVLKFLDAAVVKSDELTQGRHLSKIMRQVSSAADKLNDYIAELDRHHRS